MSYIVFLLDYTALRIRCVFLAKDLQITLVFQISHFASNQEFQEQFIQYIICQVITTSKWWRLLWVLLEFWPCVWRFPRFSSALGSGSWHGRSSFLIPVLAPKSSWLRPGPPSDLRAAFLWSTCAVLHYVSTWVLSVHFTEHCWTWLCFFITE